MKRITEQYENRLKEESSKFQRLESQSSTVTEMCKAEVGELQEQLHKVSVETQKEKQDLQQQLR